MAGRKSNSAEAPAKRECVLNRIGAALRGLPISATEEERQTFEAGRQSMERGFAGTCDQLANYLARG